MNIETLNEISSRVKTPSYVYDLDDYKSRITKIRSVLEQCATLCYAIKANPLLTRYIAEDIDYLEVCSPGELEICKKYNIIPNKILLSGVNKTQEDLQIAFEYGVRNFTAESLLQFTLLCDLAKQNTEFINIILRLSSGSQFGMSQEDVDYIITQDDWKMHVKVVGIHYFSGTQHRKTGVLLKELEMLAGILNSMKSKLKLSEIKLEYGPGLPVSYFQGEELPDGVEMLKEIVYKLKELSKTYSITLEMGRCIAADGGSYFTKVVDSKFIKGVNYAILDGGINHLNYYGQAMAMKVPFFEHISKSRVGSNRKQWCLCGSLCTVSDIIVRAVELDDLSIGDILVFTKSGAYSNTEGIYLFLSRSMPYVYLYDDRNGLRLVRNKIETFVLNMED